MKAALGLYRHMLDRDHYRFARQAGATHVVIHLVDYFNGGRGNARDNQPTGTAQGWGRAGDPERPWTFDQIAGIVADARAEGVEVGAIENFDPGHWHDVLLDGPRRAEQMEGLKRLIRDTGRAGIPVFGYNFSLAGVAGRATAPVARGGAMAVGMQGVDETPVPSGMVWNMVYDPSTPPGTLPATTADELWDRVGRFLAEMLPVAVEAGVRLALHPDDPPVPSLRGTPRLVWQPRFYDRLLAIDPSPSNAMEFCVGTLAEMTEGDLYETVDRFSRTGRVAYVHLRNVRGKAPHYWETFIDDGDVDMLRVLRILHRNGFDGMVVPDHAPQMTCAAPWHAGMAHTLGFIRAALAMLEG